MLPIERGPDFADAECETLRMSDVEKNGAKNFRGLMCLYHV